MHDIKVFSLHTHTQFLFPFFKVLIKSTCVIVLSQFELEHLHHALASRNTNPAESEMPQCPHSLSPII